MKGKYMVLCVLLIFAASFAAAGSDLNESKTELLNGRVNVLECRAEFMISQIDMIESTISEAPDLSEYKESLSSDVDSLQSLASEGNVRNFNEFVANTFKKDMKNTADQLRAVKKEFKTYNLTNDQKKSIRDSFNASKEDYIECLSSALSAHARNEVSWIEGWIDKANDRIEKLNNRSYDTSVLSGIVSEAEENMEKLNDAISTGDGDAIQQAMKEVREEHLHAWARFYGNELKLYVERLNENDVNGTYSEDLDEAEGSIDEALSLAAVGHKYTEGEFQTVKNNLQSAAEIIKNTAKALKTKAGG